MKFLIGLLMLIPAATYASIDFGATSLAERVGQVAPLDSNFTRGSYYNWGRANNGFGYCYEWTNNGDVLNEGRPVDPANCEKVSPSLPGWYRANSGWGNCYRLTYKGLVLNEGKPIEAGLCEAVSPSYYDWKRANDGFTRCYQLTRNGLVLNEGKPVDNNFCR